jgi:hypothetical protein
VGLVAPRVSGTVAAKIKHKHKHRITCKTGERRCGKNCLLGPCCPRTSCGDRCDCAPTVEGPTFCFDADVHVTCVQCENNAYCAAGGNCIRTIACGDPITAVCFTLCAG